MDHKPPEVVEGERVRAAIDAAGLSLRDAAQRAGIPRTTLDRKLRGHVPFTSTDLRRMAQMLGGRASAFLAEEEAA